MVLKNLLCMYFVTQVDHYVETIVQIADIQVKLFHEVNSKAAKLVTALQLGMRSQKACMQVVYNK